MGKFTPILIVLLISLAQCEIRKSRRSKHGEDCVSNAACEEGLICKTNRCFSLYEAKHLSQLGLLDNNVCNEKKKCKGNLVCYEHRCMDSLLAREEEKPKPAVNPDDEEDVSMVFSGSIFLNKLPYLSGLRGNNSLNYDHLFTHVTNFIKHADISVALQETVFYINPSEKFSRKLASTIVKARATEEILTTGQLAEVLKPCLAYDREKKDLARVFQALRIEVNGEMSALRQMLDSAVETLSPGGRLSILTYHSLEDRMVKNVIKTGNVEGKMETDLFGQSKSPLKAINRSVITASPEEIQANPRSRSAKLRIGEKWQR